MSEELALQQCRRHRRAVDGDERAATPRPGRVHGACDELLAGSRLAADEHRRLRWANPPDEVDHPLHRRAIADHRPDQWTGHLLAQNLDLLAQAAVLHSALQRDPEDAYIDRLVQKIIGAGAHRSHRKLHAAQPRHDDDWDIRA